nr:reverse transcriptase domain-containing protein [Tanacetum cinerariifolium]
MRTFANLPLFLWAEAIAIACFTQNRSIIHKRFDKTPYELMNKRKPNIKFFHVFGCRCYLLNDYDDVGKLEAKEDIGVFVGYSKESAAFRIYNNQTLSQVSETSKKDLEDLFHNFYDEYFDASNIMKSSKMNVETSNVKIPSNEEEVFHESSESFQEESSSSSLNDDVQQSSEEVEVPSSNTQSISNYMILNVDEVISSHNVFNERLEDSYFDATFLNGILKEEVYVGQPPGFVSTQYPDHVYALDKALFGMENCDTIPIPMVEQAKLKLDLVGKPVDLTNYQSMIGSLMYVTSTRLDIMFATCLWHSKDSGFDLTAYSDANHAGCHLDRIMLWMRTHLTDYDFFYDKVPIYCDSKSAIAISCNLCMSTRSSARNLFPPLDNPKLTIRRRPHVDPTLLNDFEMAANANDDDVPPPGGVQNSCQFHGPPGDDANKHLENFLHVTQSIKVNGVIDDGLRLYLFPHFLTHHATAWFDRLPRNYITTFEQMAKMFLGKYFPPSMVTKLRNEITNFCQRLDESLFEAWELYKLSIDRCPNHNMLPVTQIDTFYNELTLRHHDTINAAAGGTFMKRRPTSVMI